MTVKPNARCNISMIVSPFQYNQCLNNGVRECKFQWMQSKLIIPQVKLSNNEIKYYYEQYTQL